MSIIVLAVLGGVLLIGVVLAVVVFLVLRGRE